MSKEIQTMTQTASPHRVTQARLLSVFAAAVLVCLAFSVYGAETASAKFGLVPKSVDVTILNEAGHFERQASAHPFSISNEFSLNTAVDPVGLNAGLPVSDEADLRRTTVEVPPGIVGNATATPRCTLKEFMGPTVPSLTACPDNTQIGVAYDTIDIFGQHFTFPSAIYNLHPEPGQPALFAFKAVYTPVFVVPSLRSDGDYGLNMNVENIDQTVPITANKFTLWGVPASPAHDSERGELVFGICGGDHTQPPPCRSNAPQKPLLTMSADCERGPLAFKTEVQSWQGETGLPEGRTDFETVLTHDDLGDPAGVSGCERVPFEPTIHSKITTELASTASGLHFEMDIPDTGILNPEGLAQSPLKKAVVSLPEGVTLNPSAGEGMGYCTPAQYANEKLDTRPGDACPDSSNLGSVQIETPLLESGETLEGAVYLAQPDNPATTQAGAENPFDSLLAIYVVARLPERGVIIKTAGHVQLDPVTGRITTTFDNLPPLPFSSFKLHFREGARAPLASAPSCGAQATEASLTPYSAPNSPVTVSSSSTVTAGVNDGPCPAGGVPPLAPQVVSGTLNNRSGSYSPFTLRIARSDNEQEITKFSTVLPPGLTGNLTGIPFCPEAAIETARHKTGQEELANPSCPAASEIGHTLVGAGVGVALAWTPGKVYLAGPYHGSALSIVSVTSATVGPFDLGTVVVRFALRINPTTGQAEIDSTGSDPIPHILDGVVVHVREIHVYMDRKDFMLNPTSCAPLSIGNTITGVGQNIANPADDVSVDTSTHFQAADCAALKFKPSFKASTSGKTSRTRGAGLHVRLAFPAGALGNDANIHSVKVELPKQLPSRLSTLQKACPDTVFNRNPAACPPASRVGYAKANTPILPVPIEGPAYFVSHGGQKFPELILVLQGYGVTIDLHGETFISKAGITSSTFAAVPDEPVGSFELTLPQGPDSALAAPDDLCSLTRTVLVKHKTRIHGHTTIRAVRKRIAGSLLMPTTFTAQNGMVVHQNTNIAVTGCAKHKVRHGRTAKSPRHGHSRTRR